MLEEETLAKELNPLGRGDKRRTKATKKRKTHKTRKGTKPKTRRKKCPK